VNGFVFTYFQYEQTVLLFSGGKDSTYNMIQCVRNGHELVALANLHPKKDIGKND
jgi:diphthine-ammonia ligase